MIILNINHQNIDWKYERKKFINRLAKSYCKTFQNPKKKCKQTGEFSEGKKK